MKAELDSEEFSNASKACATIVGADIDLLITAIEKGFVRIEAGLNSSYIYHTLPAKVKEGGKIVIPLQRLMGIPLHSEEIILSADTEKELTFASGSFVGKLKAGGYAESISANRPEKKFKAGASMSADLFKLALSKVNFGSAIPGAQMGIRVQTGEDLIVSTTDQYRASIYKEELAVKQDTLDVLMQPDFLQGVIGKVTYPEISIGVHRGIFHLSSGTMEVYHPSIQQEPEDIDDWMDNGIDYKKRECRITLACDQFSKRIREVSSIHAGSLAYDTYFDLLIKGQKAHLRCTSDQGSTKSTLELFRSDAKRVLTKLSSRYTLEMLNLIHAGDADVSMWDDFILFEGQGGKFRGLIPTVAA